MDELIMFARENDDVARTIAHNGYDFVREYFPLPPECSVATNATKWLLT